MLYETLKKTCNKNYNMIFFIGKTPPSAVSKCSASGQVQSAPQGIYTSYASTPDCRLGLLKGMHLRCYDIAGCMPATIRLQR